MSTPDKQPSLAEWKELYSAAIEFKKVESWTWMYDSDVFGVQNPTNREIGYCSIMGALGEMYALAVYLGSEGLKSYRNLQSGKIKRQDVLFTQKCLMASFENRDALHPQDLQVIKQLGLKFRGRQAWAVFRSYRPTYYPWYLTKDEVVFLKLALEQAREVSLMLKKDPHLLERVKADHYLVRVPHSEGHTLAWETEYLKPKVAKKKKQEKEPSEPLDDLRLRRLRNKSHQSGMIWEADIFLAPMPIREGEDRPFFPRMSLFADHHSGYVFGSNAFPHSGYRSGFQKHLYDVLDAASTLPEELWVSKKEVLELIESICERLGIEARLVKKLAAVDEARSSLFEHLSQRSG
jgi:hypothetical protein